MFILARNASGQIFGSCPNCPDGTPTTSDYLPNPGGAYQIAANSRYIEGTAEPRRLIPAELGDPCIQRIGKWFYVSGTSDPDRTANFPIYRSMDLLNWEFHMMAFPPATPEGLCERPDGSGTNTTSDCCSDFGDARAINGREFSCMWAPEIYYDFGADTVYFMFTAVEKIPAATCPSGTKDRPWYQSIYVTKMPVSEFRSPNAAPGMQSKYFAGTETVNSPGYDEPLPYGYYRNNNTADALGLLRDGGAAMSGQIPVTGDMRRFRVCDETTGPCAANANAVAGDVVRNGTLYNYKNQTGEGWMALDGYVYKDPNDADRKWMLYTWREWHNTSGCGTSDLGFDGNNVSGYPMANDLTMDGSAAAAAAGPVLLGYRHNEGNRIPKAGCNPPGPPRNGTSMGKFGPNGCNPARGVAEAPAAFFHNGRNYLFYSRNGVSSPAYGIYYRVGEPGQSLRDMELTTGNRASVTEHRLVSVREAYRDLACGPSYGHGELFLGPRPAGRDANGNLLPRDLFAIFHSKVDTRVLLQGNPIPQCIDGPGAGVFRRFVCIKKLRFKPSANLSEGSGAPEPTEFVEFEDDGSWSDTDADVTILPRVCYADFNEDDAVTVQDIFDFLNAYFALDVDADTNGDSFVAVQDIFDFLNLHFAGCDWLPPAPVE